MLHFQLLKPFVRETHVIRIVEIKGKHARFILIFGELFVKYAVLFLAESDTPKAISAPAAIKEEGAVPALLAELAEVEEEAILAIRTFVAALAPPYLEAIHAVLIEENTVPIKRVLVMIRFDGEVTIL